LDIFQAVDVVVDAVTVFGVYVVAVKLTRLNKLLYEEMVKNTKLINLLDAERKKREQDLALYEDPLEHFKSLHGFYPWEFETVDFREK
jgi:hypothetical protein